MTTRNPVIFSSIVIVPKSDSLLTLCCICNATDAKCKAGTAFFAAAPPLLWGFGCPVFSMWCKKEDVVWLPMSQLSTRDQNDTEINNYRSPYGFNNEQSPYRIVSYNSYKTRKLTALFIYKKKWTKNKYVTHTNKRQPLNCRLLTWDRHIHT